MSNFVELMALRQYAEIKLNECNAAISKLDKITRTQLAKINYKENGLTKEEWEKKKSFYEDDLIKLNKKLDAIYFRGCVIDDDPF